MIFVGLSSAPAAPRINGIALTPHYESRAEGLTFDRMVDEIAQTGASHISVVVQWSMAHIGEVHIGPHHKETQDEAVVRRIIRRARARGLKVMVFPILWIDQRAKGEWRGTLAPYDREAWWASYRAFIVHFADLAAAERADLFSVGSELATMEADEVQWRSLIATVRARFSGRLLYSANWDHYDAVPFWDALDLVGLTGYYRLADTTELDPSLERLVRSWRAIRDRLVRFRAAVGRPLIITELGYPSLDGSAHSPWDYTAGRAVDLEEQRRCFEAFSTVWRDEPALSGVFFWNWWGPGGPTDGWYTLKGKPAEQVVRRWIQGTN